jgi:transposase InsO family protein
VADITYVPTDAGFLDLAVVLGVWSRQIVGWALRRRLITQLVIDAMEMLSNSADRREMSFITPTKAVSTRRSNSVGDAVKPVSAHRWDPSATATTTPCVKASSRLSSES